MVRIAFMGVTCCLVIAVSGQDRPTFPLAARTVYIYATVQGDNERLVTDLTRDGFVVLDDNRPQLITVFDNAPQPITVAVMFDMSRQTGSVSPTSCNASSAIGCRCSS